MDLSIVVPARNEQDRIEATLRRLTEVLSELEVQYEIVLGDSASSDETVERAQALRMPCLRVVRCDRPGKGRILSQALATTTGKVVGFIDADLEIDPTYLAAMYTQKLNGADAVIASKTLVPGMDADRPRHRRAVTGAYNWIVQTLFRTGISDHQAGLKLFDGPMLRQVLTGVRSNEWLWDTEVLVAFHQMRAQIVEVPVELRDLGHSQVSLGTDWFATARDLTSIFVRSRLSGVVSSNALPERA